MAETSERERLRQLEEKIARAKGGKTDAPSTGDISQANIAWQMVTELVAGIVIGLGIGLGFDALLGTKPFMLVLFILLGFVAGVRVMMRTAANVQEKQLAKAAEQETKTADAVEEERD
ncbi:AtpZ/AtpI family protein [Aliiruegeria lutimaris]|uniref:ATP synthase protein I n=1 Tax=Aliiruegeria lutimaris TaxID=571298 RepID=A0A1G8SJ66_9RHOB|nr:AtpZ/AtpI family protein [Aliiruegeria lutimaris]SDJ29247.1 ATP synthase protein I [Aliiruegeria lutimaris]